ncbi:hypothetical protein Q765_03245 [Flavobacterium rivuli WB 3.3-2 = DSM 21788]|uniref:Uncharacterized protein n=1 Tax=Flavobacterium rivuli WB 3.3-2 = DSM 21788 TaxID=1121895 RepID=A0A0A2M9H3_9FLAO|nr:hypothetical protein [Flavobacterium rivuli]KGO88083.1 hypothetical protein Q765_03245 [Flavobacterium rivuli WB 3.3-2 = DSM 21788]
MKELKNISLKKYAALQDCSDYDVLQWVAPVNLFAGKTMNINAMPWVNFKHCVRLLSAKDKDWNKIYTLFNVCFDVTEEQFWNTGIKDFYQANGFMQNQFEFAIKYESKALYSQPKDEEIWNMAGADKLNVYSDTLPLIQLGKHFGIYPYDMGRKPYKEVLGLLIQIKTQAEVETKFQEIKSKSKS